RAAARKRTGVDFLVSSRLRSSHGFTDLVSAGRGHPDEQCVALPAATTQGGRAPTAAATGQLPGHGQHHATARYPDGVTARDGAALGVDVRRIRTELPRRVDPDRGERLVELE